MNYTTIFQMLHGCLLAPLDEIFINSPNMLEVLSTHQCSHASKLVPSAAYAAPYNNLEVCEITKASATYFINVCDDTSKKSTLYTGSKEYPQMKQCH
jgi:hypothetical protein